MPFAVFVTSPRAGMGFAVAPYTVEALTVYATRPEAQAFADAKVMSPAMTALFNAMPPVHPAWVQGTIQAPIPYPVGVYRSHIGKTWRVVIGHSNAGDPSWAPGSAANLWALVENPGVTAWSGAGVLYTLPAQRSYEGRLYNLIQTHTSQPGWFPSAEGIINVLWADAGPSDSVPAYSLSRWNVVDTVSPDYTEINRVKEV